ncbi:MAG: DUF1127 domain-containing protein [Proteobacteria bacterium]|nr:DUF1127 domain-containing protein [Pseudomonadota bacterium]
MTLFPHTATPPAIPANWTASRYRSSTSIGQLILAGLRAVMNELLKMQDQSRRRHALANLDERMLADVGLTRVDAIRASRWTFH